MPQRPPRTAEDPTLPRCFKRGFSMGAYACLLALLLLGTGCKRAQKAGFRSSSGRPPASLEIINQGTAEWRISVVSKKPRTLQAVSVGPAATVKVELAAGDYDLEQTLVGTPETGEATRRFEFKVREGTAYRWRLYSLLSSSVSGEIPLAGTRIHE